jgi:hypothetical protein
MSLEKLFHIPEFMPEYFDKYMGMPTIFTFIVIFQGCFGGNGVKQTPKALTYLLQNHNISPIVRFLFVFAIGYTATSDIETALIVTVSFFTFLHLLRTSEERKEVPYLV